MEGHDFVPGSDPCQRGADLLRMLVAGWVIVGHHDHAGPAQGLAVARPPFARTHGITGGGQPEGLQGLGVFFPFDHIDGLAAPHRRQHLREVIEDGLHPLQVPDPRPGRRRVRPSLPEGFWSKAHGLMDQRPVGIDIVVGRDDAVVPVPRGRAVDEEIPRSRPAPPE
jgi:hypothetical protein